MAWSRTVKLQMNWRSLYPFRSHWHTRDNVRMHYVDEGAIGGDTLLFVHGNPTWSFLWRNLIIPLSEQARTIAIDHVGCGLSDKPQRYPYHLAQHTDNLIDFIERKDLQNVTLVAHDWGGPIGLGAALALRDRFVRLVLLNTGAFPPPFFPWRIRVCRTPLLGRIAVQRFNLFARAAIRMAVENHERMTPEIKAGMLYPYDSWSHRRAIYEFVRDIPAGPRHPTHQRLENLEQQLPQLADLPTLLLWGMRDWCFRPECLTRLETLLPQARSVQLAEAGHWCVEDAHEEIVSEIRQWLNEHPLAQESRL